MQLITTTPANRQFDIGVYSFGSMPNQNPSSVHLTVKHSGTVVGGFYFGSSTTLQSVSFPNLVAVDPTNIQGAGISVQNCSSVTSFSVPVLQICCQIVTVTSGLTSGSLSFPALITMPGANIGGTFASLAVQCASFSAPVLATLGGQLELGGSASYVFPALTSIFNPGGGIDLEGALFTSTSISFPLLTTTIHNTIAQSCPNIVTWNAPNWVPPANKTITFGSDPNLSAASVNQILARCVANPSFAGASSQCLLGGAAPTGQGITDKATLQGRGCTVVTN